MNDEAGMRLALEEASAAAAEGEVPVGCVIAGPDGAELARGHNLRETDEDPTAHAEIIAIRRAAAKLGTWRLEGCTLYVTLEPCPMCAGAMVNARVPVLVYGADDPKAGACGTLMDIVRDSRLNHRLEVRKGVLAVECAGALRAFFQERR